MSATASYQTSRMYLSKWMRAFFWLLIIAFPLIFIAAETFDFRVTRISPSWIALLIVEVPLLLVALSWHKLGITGATITIQWFPFFRRRLPVHALERASLKRIKSLKYGLGIRLIGGGTLALIHGNGPAVLLNFPQNRNYLLTMSSDEEANQTLQALSFAQASAAGFSHTNEPN